MRERHVDSSPFVHNVGHCHRRSRVQCSRVFAAGAGNRGLHRGTYIPHQNDYASRFPHGNYAMTHLGSRTFAGYPCAWAGSRDLALVRQRLPAWQVRGCRFAVADSRVEDRRGRCLQAWVDLFLRGQYLGKPAARRCVDVDRRQLQIQPSVYVSLSDTLTGKLDTAERAQAHAD